MRPCASVFILRAGETGQVVYSLCHWLFSGGYGSSLGGVNANAEGLDCEIA